MALLEGATHARDHDMNLLAPIACAIDGKYGHRAEPRISKNPGYTMPVAPPARAIGAAYSHGATTPHGLQMRP